MQIKYLMEQSYMNIEEKVLENKIVIKKYLFILPKKKKQQQDI